MNRTNVILISMDTLRADHLSCYGCRRKTSPNIDRIAAEGALFENAYSTAAWTPPAHASMFTGLFPAEHRVVDDNRLSAHIPTLAGVLRDNGYQTAGFVNNSQVGALVGLDRGHMWFDEVWKGIDRSRIFARCAHKLHELAGYADKGARETNRRVLRWLRTHQDDVAPFYLFVHYTEAHNPLRPPRPFRFRYLTRDSFRGADTNRLRPVAHDPLVCLTERLCLSDQERQSLEALYDEEIAYLDFRVGQLIDETRAAGLLDNTLFIITADHGEQLGEHGPNPHGASGYEPITHIPLIVRHPRRVAAGRREPGIVQLTDIFPTVLDVTGAHCDGADNLPGRSLLRRKGSSDRFSIAKDMRRLILN